MNNSILLYFTNTWPKKLLFLLLFLFPILSHAQINKEEQSLIDSLDKVIDSEADYSIVVDAKYKKLWMLHELDFMQSIALLEEIRNHAVESLEDNKNLTEEEILSHQYNIRRSLLTSGEVFLIHNDIEKAAEFFEVNLQFSKKHGNYFYVNHFIDIGKAYNYYGYPDKGAESFNIALEIIKEIELEERQKITIFHEFGMYFHSLNDFDKSMEYLSRALDIANDAALESEKLTHILELMGTNSRFLNDYDAAEKYYTRGMELAKKLEYKPGIDANTHHLAFIYKTKGDLAKAIEYYHISWKLSDELGDDISVAANLDMIGDLYIEMEDPDKAIFFAEECLKVSKEADFKRGVFRAWLKFGRIHLIKGEDASALKYFNQSLDLALKENIEEDYHYVYENIGTIHKKMANLDSALFYIEKSLVLNETLQSKVGIASNYLELSDIYYLKNDIDSALYFSKKSYKLAQEINNIGAVESAANLLYQIYKEEGNYALALEMHEVFISSRNIINSEKNQKEVIRQEYLYEYEKKTATDSIRFAQEQLMIQKELDVERQKLSYIIFGFGIFAILSGLLFYFYFQLRRANQKTKEQGAIIENTNKELSLSLEQQMMLQGEIHHRVKNNLQVIISLLEIQKDDLEDENAIQSLEAMSSRIFSMSAIHDILYQKEGVAEVKFEEYVGNLCKHFGDFSNPEDRPIFNIDIESHSFNLETIVPLGIIVTELITNSLKYARVEGQRLQIDIDMEHEENGQFCITYKDNGKGFPTGQIKDRDGGLGSYLLRSMTRQLQGTVETRNDNGAVSIITFKEKN